MTGCMQSCVHEVSKRNTARGRQRAHPVLSLSLFKVKKIRVAVNPQLSGTPGSEAEQYLMTSEVRGAHEVTADQRCTTKPSGLYKPPESIL